MATKVSIVKDEQRARRNNWATLERSLITACKAAKELNEGTLLDQLSRNLGFAQEQYRAHLK